MAAHHEDGTMFAIAWVLGWQLRKILPCASGAKAAREGGTTYYEGHLERREKLFDTGNRRFYGVHVCAQVLTVSRTGCTG